MKSSKNITRPKKMLEITGQVNLGKRLRMLSVSATKSAQVQSLWMLKVALVAINNKPVKMFSD